MNDNNGCSCHVPLFALAALGGGLGWAWLSGMNLLPVVAAGVAAPLLALAWKLGGTADREAALG